MMEDMERISEMCKMLEDMGATDEEIIKIWAIVLETSDKIVKEAE